MTDDGQAIGDAVAEVYVHQIYLMAAYHQFDDGVGNRFDPDELPRDFTRGIISDALIAARVQPPA